MGVVDQDFAYSFITSSSQFSHKTNFWWQGCQFLLSIGGDNWQFYPNFALLSTLGGGMKLDQDVFQLSKLSEDQKTGLHQK